MKKIINAQRKSIILAQHDGVRTTIKKGTPKILSKSISRMPMGSQSGWALELDLP